MKRLLILQACTFLLVLTVGSTTNAQETTGTESWRNPDNNPYIIASGDDLEWFNSVHQDLLSSQTEHVYLPSHVWVKGVSDAMLARYKVPGGYGVREQGKLRMFPHVNVPAGVNEFTTQTYVLSGKTVRRVYQLSPDNRIRWMSGGSISQ